MYGPSREELMLMESTIGNHHQNIRQGAQQLISLLSSHSPPYDLEVKSTLEVFILYIKQHLQYEEATMALLNWPIIDQHKDHCASFVVEVSYQLQKLRNNDVDITTDIMIYIRNWLDNHDTIHDKPFLEFIKKKLASYK